MTQFTNLLINLNLLSNLYINNIIQFENIIDTFFSLITFSSTNLFLISFFSILMNNILNIVLFFIVGLSFLMGRPTPAQIGAILGGVGAAIQTAAAGAHLYDRFGGSSSKDNNNDDDEDKKDKKSKEESTSKNGGGSNKAGTSSTTNKG
jgi:membrane-associated protease RseP (regulator of RpoE activity)